MCGNAPACASLRGGPPRPARPRGGPQDAAPQPGARLVNHGRPAKMEISRSPKLAMNRIPVRCAGLVLALAACVAPVSLGYAQDAPMTGQPLDLRPRPPAPRKKPKPASHHAKPAEAPARYMALPAEPAAKPAAAEKTEAPAAAKAPSKDEAAPQPAPTEAAKPEHAEAPGPAPARSVAQDYCMNAADVASQALVAWKAKRLA